MVVYCISVIYLEMTQTPPSSLLGFLFVVDRAVRGLVRAPAGRGRGALGAVLGCLFVVDRAVACLVRNPLPPPAGGGTGGGVLLFFRGLLMGAGYTRLLYETNSASGP